MTSPSRTRRAAALVALALGGFAVGLSEFAPMGLLRELAKDLLPELWVRSSEEAAAQAGWTITTYALGVVTGAPTIAAVTARARRDRLVVALLALFAVTTLLTALAPTFGLVVLARFLAGLSHGAYFGAAGLVAASLIGPGSEARGYASVLLGLTVSTVVGVPAVTSLGQAAGWRVAFLAVAGLFGLAATAVFTTVPGTPADPDGSPHDELRALTRPQVWLAALTATVGFAGFFAAYSYVAPITTDVTGLPDAAVPWVLVAAGVGMTVGNILGGLVADRDLRPALLGGFAALTVAVALLGVVARWPVGLFAGAFVVGATALFLGPALQARLIAIAPEAQLMGAAVNQSATNLANGLGAALGGFTIARGHGVLSAAWVGVTLGVAGFLLTALTFRLERRQNRSQGA